MSVQDLVGTTGQRRAIIINVKFINRHGEEKIFKQNLQHFMQSKKVRPDQYFPADDYAVKMVSLIPLDIVPSGTTEADVKKAAENFGSKKGHKKSTFDEMIEAIESGRDVQNIEDLPPSLEPVLNMDENHNHNHVILDPNDSGFVQPEAASLNISGKMDNTVPAGSLDDGPDSDVLNQMKKEFQAPPVESAKPLYTKAELNKMEREQLDELIRTADQIPDKVKKSMFKLGTSAKRDQLSRILKRG